jgi:two-component system sensor histidine kinase PilS (NtrC family)
VKNPNNALPQSISDSWYRLRLFNYFRCSLALLFIIIYLKGWLVRLVPDAAANIELYITVSAAYFVVSLLFIVGIFRKKPGLDSQVIIQTMVDIACIITLMHTTGGLKTGLGTLLIISISMTSLFLQKRITILFAAISALAIIAEQLYSQLTYPNFSPAFTQAGLLGILIFISAALASLTAKRLKESELQAERARQELDAIVQMNEHIIRKMRTGILVIKNNGKILMANNAALELLGQINTKGQPNLKSISIDLYDRFIEWNHNAIQNHQPIQQPQGMPDIQPGFSHIDSISEKSKKHHGRTLIFIEDATQIAQRFQQVKLASLGRLTASIAHEIRNPLSAISHAGQLLGETANDISEKKLTGIINSQVRRLNNIVENVLQLSRQQRGTPETINLHSWLLQFREEFLASHKLQAYQLQIKIKPETLEVLFDSSQLHQVMWNLCSNAINHSHIDISNIMINIDGAVDEDTGQIFIDIRDNGPGIDAEVQSHIFDPFFTTSSEGTGLGLYITKEVIESNRAKIRHLSPPDGGTCFKIHFQQPQ